MIIETKLHVPQTKGIIISRPHLYQLLDKGLNSKLTLITSPAGYGKSTLLSEWSTRINAKVAWVSFDRNDNNVLHFWTYIVESLKNKMLIFDEQYTHYMDADPSGYTLIAMLINRLNRLTDEVVFVWDDFHTVNNSVILNGVNYLLERLPMHVHVYIASRTQPPLSLSRLRVEGNLIELGIDELRFGMEETKNFFNQCTDLSLSQAECTTIHARTEGWIAGIRVAALSMNDDERCVRTQKVKDKLDAMTGKHRNFTDYFFEEVLINQSEEMQQFLLKTSILERMNAELSEVVTNMPNGRLTLQQLEKDNLFLIGLDSEREWFRYHHLFQQFLRNQLETIYPEQVKSLHARAGRWMQANGYVEEALDYYINGECYEEAILLLEKFIPSLPNGEWKKLHKWLNHIPIHLLFKKPLLFLTNAASLYLSGHVEEATDMYWWAVHELERTLIQFSKNEKLQFQAGLDFLVAFRAFLEQDFDSFLIYTQKYLDKIPSGDLLISFGSERDGYHPAWDIYFSDGALVEAEKSLIKLLDMWSKTKNRPFYAHLCLDYGKLLYEWNHVEQAKTYFYEALMIGKESDNVSLIVKASLALAQIDFVEKRTEDIEMKMKQLQEFVDEHHYSELLRTIEQFQMRVGINLGKTDHINLWLQKNKLSPFDEITLAMVEEYELLVQILAVQGKVSEAMKLTDRLLTIVDNKGKRRQKLRLTICKSLLLFKQNRIVDSFTMLEKALSLAESDQCVRSFLDKGLEMKELITQYISSIQSHHYDNLKKENFYYAKRLLEQMICELGLSHSPFDNTMHERLLTKKEKTVLIYIQQGLSNKAIAQELGISLSTVKTHINNIYRKLNVHNRLLAVQKAQKLNLL